MRRVRSLKSRLLVTTLVVITLGSILIGGLLLAHARHEIDELFDAQLAQMARTLLAQRQQHDDNEDHRPALHRHEYERKIGFALFDDKGELIGHSNETQISALPAHCHGFQTIRHQAEDLRLFCSTDRISGHVIVAWQSQAIRNELAGKIVGTIFLPILLGLPLLAFAVWWAIGRTLQPLTGLSTQIGQRSARDLAPIDPGSAPAEISPIIATLNQLLTRIEAALEQERRFTADAAHELRTPLAALRIQIEVAQEQNDLAANKVTLAKAIQAVDRATSLVEQLLQLARLDEMAGISRSPLDLQQLARAELNEHAAAACAKHIQLLFEADSPQPVDGHPELLRILLRNLLNNAIQYTPDGGKAGIRIHGCSIAVFDNGPGIATTERQHLLQRFARGKDAGGTGHGLGLSIVSRIAELHQATLSLQHADSAGGLLVRLDFPAPPSSPPA